MTRKKLEWVEVTPVAAGGMGQVSPIRIYRSGKDVLLVPQQDRGPLQTFNRKDLIAALREAGDLPKKPEGMLR